jgi:hypothetical protein
MSQQSEMADAAYQRMMEGPLPMAHLVRELRQAWGEQHGVLSVHGFVREVATCLLHHDDVEVGDVEAGRFVGWKLEPWDANDKIDRDLMSMASFLEDESRCVFRRK